VSEVTSLVQQTVGDDANIIFGAVVDSAMTDELRVTVIATGFGHAAVRPNAARRAVSVTPIRPSTPAPAPLPRLATTRAHEERHAEPAAQLVSTQAAASFFADAVAAVAPAQPARFELPAAHLNSTPAATPARVVHAAAAPASFVEAKPTPAQAAPALRPLAPPRPAADRNDPGGSAFGSASAAPSREELDRPAFLRRTMD
jgi:cell division protein FtsZ